MDRALLGKEDAIVELFDEAFDGCIDLPKSMLALATQFAYGNHPQGIGQGAWALYKNAGGESEIAEPYLRLGLVIFAARNGSCPALVDRILTAHEMGLGSNRVFQPWLDEAAAQGNGTARLYRALRDVEEDPASEPALERYLSLRSIVNEHEVSAFAEGLERELLIDRALLSRLDAKSVEPMGVKCQPILEDAMKLRTLPYSE